MKGTISEKINSTLNPNYLNLSGLEIKDEDMEEILTKVKQDKPGLVELNLDKNQLTDKGAHILAEALPHFKKLTTLRLQFNQIDEQGATSLFRYNTTNIIIYLHGNQIVDQGKMLEIEQNANKL